LNVDDETPLFFNVKYLKDALKEIIIKVRLLIPFLGSILPVLLCLLY